ncbi:MAG: transcriptional regulator, TetR family [Frankiales bacterium]|nr:transcriptional regulator, TetR family [Frankiales bacterium]
MQTPGVPPSSPGPGPAADVNAAARRHSSSTDEQGVAAAPRPASKRARTRARLLQAARVVFERDGFHDTRLSDIVQEAAVSIGTFYNYYDSKEEIFRDLIFTVHAQLRPEQGAPGPGDDPVDRIRQANRAYLTGYRDNARLWALLLQVSPQDPELFRVGQEIAAAFQEPIARAIGRWQAEGRVWPDLDPRDAARALAYMVDRYAYEWLGLGLARDGEQALDTLSKLWARGLGLDRPSLPTGGPSPEPASSVEVRWLGLDAAGAPSGPDNADTADAADPVRVRRLVERLLQRSRGPAGSEEGGLQEAQEQVRQLVEHLVQTQEADRSRGRLDRTVAAAAVLGMVEGLRPSLAAGLDPSAAAETVMSLLRLDVPVGHVVDGAPPS